MNARKILLAALFVFIVAGCSSPDADLVAESLRESNKNPKEVIITATLDNQSDAATKTVLNAERKVEWVPGDEIVVFSDGESAKFTSINTENARKANFRGTISFVTGATEGSDPDAFVYGLYPYNANATQSGGVITTVIPSAQVGLAGSFADDLALSVAKSVSTNLSFKNAYSGIDFEFSEEGYTSVTLSSNNNEPIAGAVTITFGSDGIPVTTVAANGSSSVTLTAPGGGSFETGKRYFILCAPQTLSGGFTLTAVKPTGRAVFGITSNQVFRRNIFKDVSGYLNERATFESLNISFADANVKAICVAQDRGWDTNGDGELSYTEAAAITTIPYGVFSNNTTITSFDEFQYFTGVTSLGYDSDSDEGMDYYGAFYHCTALQSIVLPSSLTDISFGAFRECSNLEAITIPATVTRIGQVAFLDCTKLEVTMESETPCTLYKDIYDTYDEPYSFGFLTGGRVKAIFVPTNESVTAYRAAQYWSSYSSLIKNAFSDFFVDLGITVDGKKIYWAKSNLCESGLCANPEDYGDYYAWGETEPYYSSQNPLTWKDGKTAGYTWTSYKWCEGSETTLTKYNTRNEYGTVDNKKVLEEADDVAHVKLGGKWRMPTKEEWYALINNCTWEWTTRNEVNGYLVTGNNNSIFLPAAGMWYNTYFYPADTYTHKVFGHYWSSSLVLMGGYWAREIRFNLDKYELNDIVRSNGSSIRPVFSE